MDAGGPALFAARHPLRRVRFCHHTAVSFKRLVGVTGSLELCYAAAANHDELTLATETDVAAFVAGGVSECLEHRPILEADG